jgi:hypothetical protein
MVIRNGLRVASLVVLTTLAVSGLGSVSAVADGLESGDTVEIAVPQDTPISETADKLTYVAKPAPFVDASGCTGDTDLRPTQTVVVSDPGGSGAGRISGVVTMTRNGEPFVTAVPNGTKLTDFRPVDECAVSGVPYFKYTATVE